MFLQWNQGARGRGAQIALLHSVTNYVPSMGILESPLDNGSFALKGGITYRTITCATFPPENLHQIEAMVYDPTDLDIDTALAANLDTNLLGTLYSMNVNMNPPPASARTSTYPRHLLGYYSSRTSSPWIPGPISAAPLLTEVYKSIVAV